MEMETSPSRDVEWPEYRLLDEDDVSDLEDAPENEIEQAEELELAFGLVERVEEIGEIGGVEIGDPRARGRLVSGLEKFYSDPANSLIPIGSAIRIYLLQASGKDQTTIQELIETARVLGATARRTTPR